MKKDGTLKADESVFNTSHFTANKIVTFKILPDENKN